MTATEALAVLQEGNQRFTSGNSRGPARDSEQLRALASGQSPFAIILSCSDSRLPPEIIFDQGLGDLFVVRVAGNIVTPAVAGSVEYAAAHLGTKLVLVLGHSGCGAVGAAIDAIKQPDEGASPNLAEIIDQIRPAVDGLLETDPGIDPTDLYPAAVTANVRHSCSRLLSGSAILGTLAESKSVEIVGGEYNLETGVVAFL